MSILTRAVVYDIETYPNVFLLAAESYSDDVRAVWEISDWRDDREQILTWFAHCRDNSIPMIGFNNNHFDYPVIHHLYKNPTASAADLYNKAQQIFAGDRFDNIIWQRDRFAPQIDLYLIHHFDNRAKTTSLKALEINMRSPFVVDLPFAPGTILTREQTQHVLAPYNQHDVSETKRFARYSAAAIEFRAGLTEQISGDVLNFNDTKIGEKLLEQRLGDICYNRNPDTGRKSPKQTIRSRIALADIIFPYIRFQHPEFCRVLDWMKQQVLTPDVMFGDDGPVVTKGVFTGVCAHVGGLDFHFGTGGIHASVPAQIVRNDDEWAIMDVDVSSLYPSIAIVNKLAPAHLGEMFTHHYAALKQERKDWQKKKGKKCIEANSIKLALNGTYGKSNSAYSVFYDTQFTMSITINGQLLLCMLAEWLLTVPSLTIIQCNTDGITYRIRREYIEQAQAIQKQWETYTLLELEHVEYDAMWIRDVNNYVARDVSGSLKTKGAYWTPSAGDAYADSISETQPPAWHRDLGNIVSARAAVAHMTHGIDIELFIKLCTNPYDFMLRVKVDRASQLMCGSSEVQRTSRYYVSTDGQELRKISPPAGTPGAWKRKNGVSEYEYQRVMRETSGEWDERVCTKNKSKYENRVTAIQSGHKVTICNDASVFSFANISYDYYIAEARKLVI